MYLFKETSRHINYKKTFKSTKLKTNSVANLLSFKDKVLSNTLFLI